MGLNFLSWNWLPLLPLLVIYVVSSVAETNRHPFDVVEGESEIVAGHMVEYSGMSFAIFFGRVREHDPVVYGGNDHVPRRLGGADRSRAIARIEVPSWVGSLSDWFWLLPRRSSSSRCLSGSARRFLLSL